jgi:hypothetical protein
MFYVTSVDEDTIKVYHAMAMRPGILKELGD